MYFTQDSRPAIKCDNCGKESYYSKGSSHLLVCCSDECCKEIDEKIDKNISSKEYKKAANEARKAKLKQLAAKYKGTNASFSPFDNI